MDTEKCLLKANTLDFTTLNKLLLERYKLLDSEFISNLQKHREKQYFLASSEGFNFIAKEYATEQITAL